ncbi:MAG: GntR family transcriptional regulator [Pseudonocardiaceae bacterium]|nr:GntR family transcriptional regulator [Pseudonocardiaceae bacterium]
MTRYLDVSNDIVRRVGGGELVPGDELPSLRELAAQRATTVSTVSRAYRHLADGGVIVLGGRRRATVARDGVLAARRLTGAARVFRLTGSDDPALDVLLHRAGRAIVTVAPRGSSAGLTALSRGDADGAAIHLLHRSGDYNVPFARALLRGQEPTLIRLWRREQGLLVPAGNPGGIRGPGDLGGMRLALREPGSGTRVLLDRSLSDAGIDPDAVCGPVAGSHLEVALAVACGTAEAGLGVRAAALSLDLEFVPVAWEHFDLVLAAEALGAAAPLVEALREPGVRAAIGRLGGYDLDGAGTVHAVG